MESVGRTERGRAFGERLLLREYPISSPAAFVIEDAPTLLLLLLLLLPLPILLLPLPLPLLLPPPPDMLTFSRQEPVVKVEAGTSHVSKVSLNTVAGTAR